MKLVLCKNCQDVFKLSTKAARVCACGQSSGRYLADGWYAEISGTNAVAICFLNNELADAVISQPESGGRGIEFTAFVAAKDHPTIKRL